MKLPADAVIAREKLTRYLLRKLPENDKSGFLAMAGYTVPSRLLSRPSGTLSSIQNGGEGRGEEDLITLYPAKTT